MAQRSGIRFILKCGTLSRFEYVTACVRNNNVDKKMAATMKTLTMKYNHSSSEHFTVF